MKQIFITSNRKKDNISYYENEPAILVTLDREDLGYLKELEFGNCPAIYILIGEDKRYIGQTADQGIYRRLLQHSINEKKDWFNSIIFFGRADGKLPKTQTDYLEQKLIDDFMNESDFDIQNGNGGHKKGFIDPLSKSKANELYDIVFEILNDIANINLFEKVSLNLEEEETQTMKAKFSVSYMDKIIEKSTAAGLYIAFVKELFEIEEYRIKLNEMVVEDKPSSTNALGKKKSTYNGRPNSYEVTPGIYLFSNYNRKTVKKKIESLAQDLDLQINLAWHES